MRVFALSDVHVDYASNAQWIVDLSRHDYKDDLLILAGDVSDDLRRVESCLTQLAARFRKVVYVPGNHDLWVVRDQPRITSFDKLELLRSLAAACDIAMGPFETAKLAIVPIPSWYDFSFGQPSEELRRVWADFTACHWPTGVDEPAIAARFMAETGNRHLDPVGRYVITASHFVPRSDLLPWYPGHAGLNLLPVLGSRRIDTRLRSLGAALHVYGHSHVNRRAEIDGVAYVNNALGYPHETSISNRSLRCIHDD